MTGLDHTSGGVPSLSTRRGLTSVARYPHCADPLARTYGDLHDPWLGRRIGVLTLFPALGFGNHCTWLGLFDRESATFREELYAQLFPSVLGCAPRPLANTAEIREISQM